MRVHFTGACGRTIGSLALELQRSGWRVTASDEIQYPPMNQILRDAGLVVSPDYSAERLDQDVEVLVTGSQIPAENVEVREARRRGIEVLDMAEFLGNYLLRSGKRIVVAGTNGKTTTTAMLAWILECSGRKPDFLIGGQSPHFELCVRMRGSSWTVLEGDEYPSNRQEREPKFHHYRADNLIVTNLSFDHAEVYRDLDEIMSHFSRLMSRVPKGGEIIVPGESAPLNQMADRASGIKVTVGFSRDTDHCIEQTRLLRTRSTFLVDGLRFSLRLPGRMNILNAAMAAVAARGMGISMNASADALAEFRGVMGRLETFMDDDRGALISDEGYHPEAIRENLAALRGRYSGRRLVMVLLPRFTGGRAGFQMRDLPDVLARADRVVIAGLFDPEPFPDGPFSPRNLVARLRRRGVPAHCLSSPASLPLFLSRIWRRGDVVLCSLPPGHEVIIRAIRDQVKSLSVS